MSLVDVIVAVPSDAPRSNPNRTVHPGGRCALCASGEQSTSELAAAVELFAQVGGRWRRYRRSMTWAPAVAGRGSPDAAIEAYDRSLIIALDIGAAWDAHALAVACASWGSAGAWLVSTAPYR